MGTNATETMLGRSPLTAKGFTLIEIIVILAVISILVAILTPTVLKYISEAQSDRAQSDVGNISAMINDLIKDTGQYPGNKLASGKTFLCSGTSTIAGGNFGGTTANCESLENHLVVNSPGTAATTDDYPSTGKLRWKGPYITNSTDGDPWGNAYEVNASTLVGGNTSVTWVISAGPDGTFQTSTSSTTLSGDDIGVRIK